MTDNIEQFIKNVEKTGLLTKAGIIFGANGNGGSPAPNDNEEIYNDFGNILLLLIMRPEVKDDARVSIQSITSACEQLIEDERTFPVSYGSEKTNIDELIYIALDKGAIKSKKLDHRMYLRSYKWGEKRRAVLRRANYKCEGCGEYNTVLDLHHLTYKHFKDEFLFELVALCRDCHTRIHSEVE